MYVGMKNTGFALMGTIACKPHSMVELKAWNAQLAECEIDRKIKSELSLIYYLAIRILVLFL